MTREQYISDLRAAADFFEQHQEITELPGPYMFANVYGDNAKEALRSFAKAAGKIVKEYSSAEIQVSFYLPGGMLIQYSAPRNKVCERVVVGVKCTPEHILPARAEMLIPAKEEEIVEWRCAPLLEEATA